MAEIEKYQKSYQDPRYGMSRSMRRPQAEAMLRELSPIKSYLDIGCGRGEMMDYASVELGVSEVWGTEVVRELYVQDHVVPSLATEIPFPDDSFDVVASFDVLEHLLEDDVDPALRELTRVARRAVLLTVSNTSSVHMGEELHVTRWPYPKWRHKLSEVFKGWDLRQPTSAVAFNQPFLITRH